MTALNQELETLNTYRAGLRHELFCGRLSQNDYQASEHNLVEFLGAREATKPHLSGMFD